MSRGVMGLGFLGVVAALFGLGRREQQQAASAAHKAPPITQPEPEAAVSKPVSPLVQDIQDRVLPQPVTIASNKRGIRNNNPGNIENNGIGWKGLAATQTDSRFYQFVSPEYGIRAMARILANYQRLYGLNTIELIINRWAPPVENNTQAYVNHVAAALNVHPNQPINVQDYMPELVEMIIKHENGEQPYPMQTIVNGVLMA